MTAAIETAADQGSSADADTHRATDKLVVSGPTPGPWEYVPGNEHHGPYITSDFGSTIADCYVMSRESVFSSEPARPISFLAEMAEPNARLIAAAPDLLAVAVKSHEPYEGLTDQDVIDLYGGREAALCLALRATITKATGQAVSQ